MLKWRTDKPDEAYKIWEALADVNEDIQGNLNDLWGLAEVQRSLSLPVIYSLLLLSFIALFTLTYFFYCTFYFFVTLCSHFLSDTFRLLFAFVLYLLCAPISAPL